MSKMNPKIERSSDVIKSKSSEPVFFDESVGLEELWDIVEGMSQGILVWDDNGRCRLFTKRLLDLLEMRASDISIGATRDDFLKCSLLREELSEEKISRIRVQYSRHIKFQYDRTFGLVV